ncbi:MAG: sulfite exporter TauE/SafE family protein [Candidatus Latescibacterota bacterium]
MLQTLDLLGFLTVGVLGGFGHCTGMCTPLVLFVGRRFGGPEGRRAQAIGVQMLYSAGRLVTYAALGVAAGALGSAVELAGAVVGLQRGASVVAGAVLASYAGASLLGVSSGLARTGGPPFGRVAHRLQDRTPASPFVLGLLLGLLPCGLVYSALIAAAALGDPVRGAAGLALFGLGTMPALLGIGLADELLVRHRRLVNRLSQVLLLGMGAWFVGKGISGGSG